MKLPYYVLQTVILCFWTLHCGIRTYVLRTNKMHAFFINDLIQLYCLRHVSNNQVFILRKTCTCSFMVFMFDTHPDIDQTAYMDAWKNTIKLHVQVFLEMNTCMFETCRRQYNWIKSLITKVCILLVLIIYVYHNAWLKKHTVCCLKLRNVILQLLWHFIVHFICLLHGPFHSSTSHWPWIWWLQWTPKLWNSFYMWCS
jgi:hypothetical protein